MAKITGSCLCGTVKYSSEAQPLMTTVCHCESCQRQSGSAFSIVVGIPEESLSITNTDALGQYTGTGDTGGAVHRRFCKHCGSPILSVIDMAPGVAVLKAGTLDDKSWLNPTNEIWCSDAQSWVEFAEGLERHDGNPG